VKYRLEATHVTADADAEMVVPHSLDLTSKTTTVQPITQSLAVSVLDLVIRANRKCMPAQELGASGGRSAAAAN
jgi:hypothetical protein